MVLLRMHANKPTNLKAKAIVAEAIVAAQDKDINSIAVAPNSL